MGSKKPCPGCGEVKKWRKATEVCSDCKDNIRDGRIYVELVSKPDTERLTIPGQSYLYPTADREFCKAFDLLIKHIGGPIVSKNCGGKKPFTGSAGGGWGYSSFVVKKGTADALRVVWDSVLAWANKNTAMGHRAGRSILGNLASGDMTMGDFNERAAREDDKL